MGSVGYDAVSSAVSGVNVSGSSAAGTSASITAAAGADVFFGIQFTSSTTGVPSSVQCDGVAMTLVDSQRAGGVSNAGATYVYRAAGAGKGTSANSITYNVPGVAWYVAGAVSATNVDPSATITTTKASGNSSSVSSGSIAPGTGQLAICFYGAGNSGATTVSAHSGGTNVLNGTTSTAGEADLLISYSASTATYTATLSGSQLWSSVAIILSPSAIDKPTTATVTITGDAVSEGQTVAPTTSTVTITGGQVTESQNVGVIPASATITITPGTPDESGGGAVSPTGATVTITGSIPLEAQSFGPMAQAINKFTLGQDVTFYFVGDSTVYGYADAFWSTLRGWVGRMVFALAEYYNYNIQWYEIGHPFAVAYDGPTNMTPSGSGGGGRPTLTVYHGGWSGATIDTYLVWEAQWFPVSSADLVIIQDGFNEASTSTFISNYATLISDIQTTRVPGAPILLTTGNATTATAESTSGHPTLAAIWSSLITAYLPSDSLPLSPPVQQSTVNSGVWVIDTQQAGQTAATLNNDGNAVIPTNSGLHPIHSGYAEQAQYMLWKLITASFQPAADAGLTIPGSATSSITTGTPTVHQTPQPPSAVITITPGTPSEDQGVSPPSATPHITGGTPSEGQTVSPPSAHVTIVGDVVARGVQPPSAVIAVVGGVPSVGQTVSPASAQLAIGGSVPPTGLSHILEPGPSPDALTSANVNLRPFQYQIGAFVFGHHTMVPVNDVKIESYNINAQDFQVIRTDERQFGIDTLAPGTITFTMGVLDNSPLPNILGLTGEQLPPSLVARQGVLLPALAKEWKANEVRPIWGQTKPLFFCDSDGITRRIYGRPGKFAYSRTSKQNAYFNVQAEYRRSDTYAHSDAEYFAGPLPPDGSRLYAARQGGDADSWFRILLFGPMTNPNIIIGSLSIQLNATINDGVIMEISSYPWIRRIIDTNNRNWRAFMTSPTYLDQMVFPADFTIPIYWYTQGGTPVNQNTKMLFLWREAYNIA